MWPFRKRLIAPRWEDHRAVTKANVVQDVPNADGAVFPDSLKDLNTSLELLIKHAETCRAGSKDSDSARSAISRIADTIALRGTFVLRMPASKDLP